MTSPNTSHAYDMIAIDKSIACPYPGARPLSGEGEASLLRGRDAFAEDFLLDVSQKRVVELTADSGAGKSSLLDTLIVPTLRAQKARVVVLRSWADLIVTRDTSLYAAAIRNALDAGDANGITGVDELSGDELVDELERKYHRSLVLVFDQLEELFRDDSTVGRRFVAELAERATNHTFHHILSLRNEYKVGLEPIERTVPTDLWRWYPLPQLSQTVAPEIITVPAKREGIDANGVAYQPFEWDEDAVTALTTWWATAKDYAWQVGLLQLQAFLWVTFHQVKPNRGDTITLDDLRALWPDAPADGADLNDPDARDSCVRLFEAALRLYVEGRLGGPALATDSVSRERLFSMARIVTHLSSVGYKLVRESTELAELALPGLDDLRLPRSFLSNAVRAARALCGPKERVDVTESELLDLLLDGKFSDPAALVGGDPSVPAGRMKGKQPSETGAALVIAFENALQVLKRESIVRFTPTTDGLLRIAMVHDGFGPALDAWSEKIRSDPGMTIEALTTITSKQLFKAEPDDDGNVPREHFGPDRNAGHNGISEIRNVGWISCYVDANFTGVLLDSSDLKSTLFIRCVFKDVTFRECQLWGALFVDCTFDGTTVDGPDELPGDTPDRPEDGVKTLTFSKCVLTGKGLTITAVKGYGVFFDKCNGGPWTLHRSDLMHVMADVKVERDDQVGRIIDCPRLAYLSGTRDKGDYLPTIDAKSNVRHINEEYWITESPASET